jgi:hypothetical protein
MLVLLICVVFVSVGWVFIWSDGIPWTECSEKQYNDMNRFVGHYEIMHRINEFRERDRVLKWNLFVLQMYALWLDFTEGFRTARENKVAARERFKENR